MNFIFLAILVIASSVKSEEDDIKYIDLLPESEKQEFLNKIARRLLREVNSKVTNMKTSVEIPEEELDEHGDFVKKILAEESSNLRRDNDENEEAENSSNFKGVDESKSEEMPSGHIDLTLRNGHRIKRNNTPKQLSDKQLLTSKEIPTKVVHNDVKNRIADSNITNIKIKTLNGEESDGTDIQVKGLSRNSRSGTWDHTIISNYDPDETTEKIKENVDSNSNETPLVPKSNGNGFTASIYEEQRSYEIPSDVDGIDETTKSSSTVSSEPITTEPTKLDSTTEVPTGTTLTTQVVEKVIENTTESKQKLYLRLADKKSLTDDMKISSLNESTINSIKVSLNESNETTKMGIFHTTESPLSDVKSIEHSDTEKRNETKNPSLKDDESSSDIVVENATTTKLPIAVTSHSFLASMASTVYKALGDIMSSNKTSPKGKTNETKEVAVLKNMVKALRSGLKFDFEEDEIEEKDDGRKKSKHSLENLQPLTVSKTYEVYEIPADQAPFIRDEENDNLEIEQTPVNEEQPYYVPIYNYSPENAYFNSYNRLGPNYDQTPENMETNNYFKDKIENKHIQRKRKTDGLIKTFKFDRTSDKKKKYTTRVSKPNREKLKLPLVIQNPKFTEVYFNPNDYLDMDYYFGRSMHSRGRSKSDYTVLAQFPNSDDEDHVYNAMRGGKANTHANAIRQMLYSRHIFGHIPDTTTTKAPEIEEVFLRSKQHNNKILFKSTLKNSVPDDNHEISIDYYFGLDDEFNKNRNRKKISAENFSFKTVVNSYKHHGREQTPKNIQREALNPDDTPPGKKQETIKDILSIDPTNAFLYIDELLKHNIPLSRSVEDLKIKPFVNVLKDMIEINNEALEKFDWLGTTVDIQSALEKLLDIIEALQDGDTVHPSDLQLLEYIQYLYVISKTSMDEIQHSRGNQENTDKTENNPIRTALPRNKNRKKEYLKAKGLLHRAWLFIRARLDEKLREQRRFEDLQKFLDDLQTGLYDLHNALKSIASITKFNKQRWYQNLKELYLKDVEEKQILEILLHLSATRLLGLIEDAAKNGLEDGYTLYIEKNENDVMRTKDEFLFLLQILKELKNI